MMYSLILGVHVDTNWKGVSGNVCAQRTGKNIIRMFYPDQFGDGVAFRNLWQVIAPQFFSEYTTCFGFP